MRISIKVAASRDTSATVLSPRSISLTTLESPPTILIGGEIIGTNNGISGSTSSLGTIVNPANTVSIAGNVVLGNATTVQEILIISQDSLQTRQSSSPQQQHQRQQTVSLAPAVRDISSTGGVMTG